MKPHRAISIYFRLIVLSFGTFGISQMYRSHFSPLKDTNANLYDSEVDTRAIPEIHTRSSLSITIFDADTNNESS